MGNTSYVRLLLAEGFDPWNVERVICEGSSLVSRWVVVLSQALPSRGMSSPAGFSGRLSPHGSWRSAMLTAALMSA